MYKRKYNFKLIMCNFENYCEESLSLIQNFSISRKRISQFDLKNGKLTILKIFPIFSVDNKIEESNNENKIIEIVDSVIENFNGTNGKKGPMNLIVEVFKRNPRLPIKLKLNLKMKKKTDVSGKMFISLTTYLKNRIFRKKVKTFDLI